MKSKASFQAVPKDKNSRYESDVTKTPNLFFSSCYILIQVLHKMGPTVYRI